VITGVTVKLDHSICSLRRWSGFFIAALFLTFLISSTPHQVHHVFDHVRHSSEDSDHHTGTDHRSGGKQNPTCVFESVASRCHASAASVIDLSAIEAPVQFFTAISKAAGHQRFIPAIFQIRAPPLSPLVAQI
jgi:hypothetical protein